MNFSINSFLVNSIFLSKDTRALTLQGSAQFLKICSNLVAHNCHNTGKPYYPKNATIPGALPSATNIENSHAAVKCCLISHLIRTSNVNKHCIQICGSSKSFHDQ